VNPGTGQLWQTNCDISANGGKPEKNASQQKRSTSETKADGSQQRTDLTPPTTDTRQMVRATASSPIDKPHLRTLSIGWDPLQKQNLKDLNKGHSFPTTRTRPNNQWVWWKQQNAKSATNSWQHSIASKDRTPHCCTDAASTQTVDSIQHATSETWSTSKL
jgi:hypothetical protein